MHEHPQYFEHHGIEPDGFSGAHDSEFVQIHDDVGNLENMACRTFATSQNRADAQFQLGQ